jgi:4-amino-4-deoxy-L-arabinose transferase-like glycosyltransferase
MPGNLLETIRHPSGWHPLAPILLILAVAILVRLLIALPGFQKLELGGAYTLDSPRYENLALTLLHDGEYRARAIASHKGVERKLYDGPEYFRVPGYPVFLASVFAVTGYSTQAALAVQVVLAGLTCVLLYLIGTSLHSRALGFISAILMILNLKAGIHAGQITSEVFFTFVLVLCLYSAWLFWNERSVRFAVLCAATFMALSLTRPIGLHLTVLFAIVTAFHFRNRRTWALVSIPLLAVILSLQAWSYRNYVHSGVWAVTSNETITIGLWYPATIWAHAHNREYRDGELEVLRRHSERQPQYRYIYEEALADPEPLNVWISGKVHDIGFAKSIAPTGLRIMLEEWPTTLITTASGGIWSLFAGMGEWRNWIITNEEYRASYDDVLEAKKSLARFELGRALTAIGEIFRITPGFAMSVFVLMGVYQLVLVAGAVIGLRRLLNPTYSPLAWLLLLWSLYMLVTAGPSGNSRYVAPLLPLLCLLAAFGFQILAERFRMHRQNRVKS